MHTTFTLSSEKTVKVQKLSEHEIRAIAGAMSYAIAQCEVSIPWVLDWEPETEQDIVDGTQAMENILSKLNAVVCNNAIIVIED